VSFLHPLRPGVARVMCIIPCVPPAATLAGLLALEPIRGEAFVTSGGEAAAEAWRSALVEAGLGLVSVNATEAVGHVLHDKAAELHAV
jgi:hypothetical protein